MFQNHDGYSYEAGATVVVRRRAGRQVPARGSRQSGDQSRNDQRSRDKNEKKGKKRGKKREKRYILGLTTSSSAAATFVHQ